MTSKKALITVICIILYLGMINASNAGLCLAYNKKNNQCLICYKSKINPATGDCGPLLPSTGKCLFFRRVRVGRGIDVCALCQQGYAVNIQRGVPESSCIKPANPIQNCLYQLNVFGKEQCRGCIGGAPSVDRQTCIPWAKVKYPINDCKVGGLDSKGQTGCQVCNNSETFNFDTHKCATIQGQTGCLGAKEDATGKLVCTGCDVYNGYSMGSDLKCRKL